MSLTIVLLLSFLFNSLMVLLVLYLIYKGDKAINEFEPYLKDVEGMRHTIAKRGSTLLERTVDVAQDIIRNAMSSSQRNLKVSEEFQKELQNQLVGSLEQNISDTKQIVQEKLVEILETYRSEMLKFNKDLNETALEARREMLLTTGNKLYELSESIQNEIAQVRKNTQDEVSARLSSVDQEINKYKEEKLKDINEKIYKIVDEATKKVINKSLDLAEHQDIVLAALEKARKENLF